MDKVRIGSIGLGRLGAQHAENIATKIPNAELVALCDMDTVKLKETAERLHVSKTFTDFDDMIACNDIDAVVIVSPSGLHTEQIEKALASGNMYSLKNLSAQQWNNAGRRKKRLRNTPTKCLCLVLCAGSTIPTVTRKQK